MIAFRVSINGQPPIVGGATDLSVLTAIVTANGVLGKDTRPVRPENEGETNIDFRLGGLTSRAVGVANEHVVWLENVSLAPGDTVTVEIIESESADPVPAWEMIGVMTRALAMDGRRLQKVVTPAIAVLRAA